MNYKRRDFVKLSATLGAGLALGSVTNTLMGCSATSEMSINKNFGLQLYTLRDVLPKDPVGVLKQVASFGYKQIESYEGPSGMFWGMKNTEFKKLMDDLGMKIVSSHCDMNKDFERKAAEAGQIGMDYLLCPHLGAQKSINDFKHFAEVFNQKGEVCKKNGMRFGYHNHDYSFVAVDGQLPQDVMMQNTNKDLVDFEMDIYWVVTAGQDPVKWLDKYPGRFKLGHVKDRKKGAALTDRDASVDLGTGSINWPQLLKHASDKGMKYFIVEQEAYVNTTPLDASRVDAEYLKNLKI
jgi:sugar phosphate isomerase/epimerase